MGIVENGPVRRFLRNFAGLRFPQAVDLAGVNSQIKHQRDELMSDLRARGMPEGLQAKAVTLADEWALKMSSTFVPREIWDDPKMRQAIIRANYPRAVEVAKRWAEVMSE